ncbi:carbonic anhydrase [Xylogone sp. PMI_703]|nr:carbonic anhydrase [Xylogone sp. PMI_703]
MSETKMQFSKYAQTYTAAPLISELASQPQPPEGSTVIISCADPRLIPEEFFGFSRLRAGVIRNAGGRAMDAIRSLVVLDGVMNVRTVIVVHHTDCGATHQTDEGIRQRLKKFAGSHSHEIDQMKFGEITNLEKGIREDMQILKSSPYLSKDLEVYGFLFDLKTGGLTEVTI